VVEIASPYGLARASSIALAACSSAQAEAKLRGDATTAGAWCAWIEASLEGDSSPRAKHGPASSLFAPAVARAGVDLGRLLVVRPTPADLARVAARVAQSRVFSVVVVDLAGVPGQRPEARLDRWVSAVRRLALAVEGTPSTVILLTDLLAPRAVPLPVALRLEIDRPSASLVRLAIAKDRRGRVARAVPVTLPSTQDRKAVA
jgi:recombination protein RecA